MSSYEEIFKEEEELRLGLEESGREHDCLEAGCSMNPKGELLPPGLAKRRKPLSARLKELLKKLRGIEVVEAP